MVRLHPAVFLFIGNDSYSKERAVESLGVDISKGVPEDLEYKVFHGRDADPSDVLDHIRTVPLFSEKRLILIRDAGQMSSEGIELLAGKLKDLSQSTCLVFDFKDDSVLKIYPALAKAASVKMFGELKGQGLISWATDLVTSRSGKTIENEAVRLLAELKGALPIDLVGELEKLMAFTGDRKTIKASDVEEAVGRSVSASAFDLSWEIGKKDAFGALRLVSDLVGSGKRPHEIVGILSWHLKRVLRALVLKREGRSDHEISREVRVRRD
ncbi:MAG: DNA polymerase III subunit delta, partial [Candidatus Omnitrophica bacterium]|nr:DNA polymerase III subunit delta [Candidatus Omnitrophota bacterium]